jgi:GNAT superfamily N-acetyltransferase
MDIELKPVNRKNWEEALALQVLDPQQGFVPAVAVSLAKIYIKPDGEQVEYIPFAIYDGNRMVGFIMHAYEVNTTDGYWINGFLIDAKEQGKGYGRAAILQMITWIQSQFPQCEEIRLTVHKDNRIAKTLYSNLGFAETGNWFGDEEVLKLDVLSNQEVKRRERDEMSQINIHRSSSEEAQSVRTNLIKFNAQFIAEDLQQNYEEINLHIKDENDEIAGGINSVFCWNWIEVDILWVDDRFRGRGYGSRLLQEIERIAREKQCTFIKLNTFSFQAPEFYRKHGFQEITRIDDAPRDHQHYYFIKYLE